MNIPFFAPAKPAGAQVPQQQQQQQQQTAPQTPGMTTPATGDAFQPSQNQDPQQQTQGTTSPLDQFNDLWNPATPEQQAVDPYEQPIWGQDINNPEVTQAINGVNFFQVTPENQEVVQRALQGDVGAFAQVVNQAVRAGFKESMGMTARMTDKSAKIAMERMRQTTPSAVVNTTAQNILFQEMPQVSHPATKQFAVTVLGSLQQKNPTWTPNQVAEAAKSYFQGMTAALNPTSTTSNPNNPAIPGTNGSEDFSDFFAPARPNQMY